MSEIDVSCGAFVEYPVRPTIHQALLKVAFVMSERSTCPSLHVGCVIARAGRILSSGYNGAPAGMAHCDHPPASSDPGRPTCEVAVHDVANAVAFAARHGTPLHDAAAYCTDTPCLACAKLLIQAGITELYAVREYRNPAGVNLLAAAGIKTTILEDL